MAKGARLGSDVSLLVFTHPTCLVRLLPLAAFAGLALLSLACDRRDTLADQGLPEDLPHYFGQIDVLKVPRATKRLDWLPPTIKALDASETGITAIPTLVHMEMERLDVRGAKRLEQLPTLPSSIRELDIRDTGIDGPWTFPNELRSLSLGGNRVQTLKGLNDSSLLDLTLDGVPNLRSSAGLPTSLQSLSISGATFSQLVDVPGSLKALSLVNTRIRTLKDLPLSLQGMTLLSNEVMEVTLPRSLLSLTIDGAQATSLDGLPFLNRLELKGAMPLNFWPASLNAVRVPGRFPWPEISPSLRRLEIVNEGVVLPELPAGLERLRWPGAAALSQLPAGLKHLDIEASSTELAAMLPKLGLESLDISRTQIGLAWLPSGLRSLRCRFCPFSTISSLPKSLRSLDVAGSRSLVELEQLPPGLEHLNISETSISDFPSLPPTLIELDISRTKIKSLERLKELPKLRKLTVHAGQLKRLSGLPATVVELSFVEP